MNWYSEIIEQKKIFFQHRILYPEKLSLSNKGKKDFLRQIAKKNSIPPILQEIRTVCLAKVKNIR